MADEPTDVGASVFEQHNVLMVYCMLSHAELHFYRIFLFGYVWCDGEYLYDGMQVVAVNVCMYGCVEHI